MTWCCSCRYYGDYRCGYYDMDATPRGGCRHHRHKGDDSEENLLNQDEP